MTDVLKVDAEQPDPKALARAAELIRAGQLVAFPTETVYGLGANALSQEAVARIFEAKGRPTSDPIIVHIGDRAQLSLITPTPIDETAQVLIERFFPGPLTLVLPKANGVPANVTANLPSVGLRMPVHPVARALIHAAGVPIAAPSANTFGHTSPTNAAHVLADLGGRIPLILDGGDTPIGVESTILDLTARIPKLLRHGGVPLEAIQSALQEAGLPSHVEVIRRYAAQDETLQSPGMLLRHYAPYTPLTLVQATMGALGETLRRLAAESAPSTIGLLLADEDLDAVAGIPNAIILSVGSLTNLEQAAHQLFAKLRELDTLKVSAIYARDFPEQGIGSAIHDRLVRAAAGKILYA
ncbi:MAG: L-threonylcarbamoyladenylate synthase [Anaerolineae bacterium]